MDKNNPLKHIQQLCSEARFKEALELVCNFQELDNKYVISVLVTCCNTCVAHMSNPENVSENDLCKFLSIISCSMKDVNEGRLVTYMQCIFHIIKLLARKKCYDEIIKLESIWVPSFLPSPLLEQHNSIYKSSANMLYNMIVTVGNEKEEKHKDDVLRICYIVANMYSKSFDATVLLNIAKNCAVSLANVGMSLARQEEYFLHVLNLINMEGMSTSSEESFKSFLNYSTFILNVILKTFNFIMALNFYKKVCETGKRMFQRDKFVHILKLLKFPLILLPLKVEKALNTIEECKTSFQAMSVTTYNEFLGENLYTLIYTVVVLYYRSENKNKWCDFSEEIQLELLQYMYTVGQAEALQKCSCPCKCLIGNNIYRCFSYSQFICILLDINAQYKSATTSNYHVKAAKLLTKYCEVINAMKEKDCEKWEKSWNGLGIAIHNIGTHLYRRSDAASLSYFYVLIKYYIQFEVNPGKTISKFSGISTAFNAACTFSAQDYKKCMALAALAIHLCHNQSSNLIVHWIKAKAAQRDLKTPESEEVQKITLVSAFTKFESQLAFLTEGVNLLTRRDEVDLLILELEHYKKKWKSKVPMMSAFKELVDKANLETVIKVMIKIFGDCEIMLHAEVSKMVHKILTQYEAKVTGKENESKESNLFLGVLYHMYYKYCVIETLTKNTDDMERTMRVTGKPNEPPDAVPRDPNEECDIVSSYDSLKLNRYFSVMQYLNKSLSFFTSVIKGDFNLSCSETVTSLMLYNLLIKIAFEYRLHNLKVKSLQAFQLALKLAELEKNPCHIVQATGFLIEKSDVTKSYVKYLILIADKQVGDIECANVVNLKIVLTYYICKSNALLYHDYKAAYHVFQAASSLYEAQEGASELMVIKCQLYLLQYKFVMMPCSYQIVDHKKSTLFTIHNANTAGYELCNKYKLDGAYEMSVLLEANHELTKLYYFLRCPREVRAYCKEPLILTQNLVLPFRCATYLVYLAQADLRSSRYEDGQVKLDGLADILCLTKQNLQVYEECKPQSCARIENDVAGIVRDMQEMVLDLPVPNNYKRQFSPASPTLVVEPFHLPAFIRHEGACDCMYCISFEYQELVLEKARLDALLNIKQKNVSIAMDFYHSALEFYENCQRRYESYTETVAELISYDLIPEFDKELLQPYAHVLLEYSYHLTRTNNKTEALKITNKLIDLLGVKKVEYVYLYNEALVQKLGYLMDVPSAPKAKAVDTLELPADLPNNQATTPESKQSKVTFSVQYNPMSPPKRTMKKRIPFDLSPIEDNGKETAKENSPTSQHVPKTPVPKIKIYENGTSKLKAKTPAPKVVFSERKKRNTRKKAQAKDEIDVDSSSPEVASTPSLAFPTRPESGLKTRTKLLTERLKKSTKKLEMPIVSDDNVAENPTEKGKSKRLVRKNLLRELGGEENEPTVCNGGAIRKSTRRRLV